MNQTMQSKNAGPGMGYWIGLIGKIVLAVAMMVYLGKHSLNFFMWTFQGEDAIFAWLGLFTTSIGVIIWLLAFKYVANNTWEKAIALGMMTVALIGEFAVAGFDMYMNITGQISNVVWTQEDLRSMSYVVAGLALLNGLALVADIAGMDIFDGLKKEKPAPIDNTVFDRRQEARKYQQTEMQYPYLPGREPLTQPLPFPIEKDKPTPARPPFHNPSE